MVGVGDICQKHRVGSMRANGRAKEKSGPGGYLNGCIFRRRPGFLDCPAQKLGPFEWKQGRTALANLSWVSAWE